MSWLLFGACLLVAMLTPVKRVSAEINPPGCGISGSQNLILNGSEAKQGQFPWMVYLDNGCGGSIITKRHVITAAHCLFKEGIMEDVKTVSYGHNDKRYGFQVAVKKAFPHPRYNDITVVNDIAILLMEQPFQFSERVRPLCLPERRMSLLGRNAIVSGWGEIQDSSGYPNWLHYTTMKIVPHSGCKNKSEDFDPAIQLCVWNPYSTDSFGDSGSPLFIEVQKNRYMQVGVVSYGSEAWSTYTRVDAYINWIKRSVAKLRAYEDFLPYQQVWHHDTPFIPYRFSSNNQGDSGGPLIAEFQRNRFVHVGVLSYGTVNNTHCMQEAHVYTRVEAYMPWIKRTIAKLTVYEDFEPHHSTEGLDPSFIPYTVFSEDAAYVPPYPSVPL